MLEAMLRCLCVACSSAPPAAAQENPAEDRSGRRKAADCTAPAKWVRKAAADADRRTRVCRSGRRRRHGRRPTDRHGRRRRRRGQHRPLVRPVHPARRRQHARPGQGQEDHGRPARTCTWWISPARSRTSAARWRRPSSGRNTACWPRSSRPRTRAITSSSSTGPKRTVAENEKAFRRR